MKQVEKIWAELSAKAQEVETPQEVELSEEKVELGAIEDAIKKMQKEAADLSQDILTASAWGRDVIAAYETADKLYEDAKSAYDEYAKTYNKFGQEIKFANDLASREKSNDIFGKLNQLMDINEELGRYGAKVNEVPQSRINEIREAFDKAKKVNYPDLRR